MTQVLSRRRASAKFYSASYLAGQGERAVRNPSDFNLESSRRARGFATWAALRELGRSGVADLVDRCNALARRFAEQLDAIDGCDVVNDVVLNQVLVRVAGDAETTDRIIDAVQRDGTCWLAGTTWRGERLLRISVSNHTTTEADVDRSVDAIEHALAPPPGSHPAAGCDRARGRHPDRAQRRVAPRRAAPTHGVVRGPRRRAPQQAG